ncbi:FAD/FMN-containing dehydrogenase [Lentibacillus cibarius]|uniref:FAD/FMN-containing dehydrogenase n=1 Tax=Lentibacillus cibarius TaxID=2583219 RepID=A0A549YJU3_9BACI|nr:FAD/FMN-containing dehydrogenase [Lentibacillus cibarius]TRM12132.1 FAD/FMN-containing dehydrogenase [Lentibacillus cibarius]
MKKKLVTIALAVFFVAGIGNVVFAHGGAHGFDPGNGVHNGWSFEEMVPFMKDMHPNMNQEQMEQMYQYCHGTN